MLNSYHITQAFKENGYIVSDTQDHDIKVCWKIYEDVAVVVLNGASNKFITKELIERAREVVNDPFTIPPKKNVLTVLILDEDCDCYDKRVKNTIIIDKEKERVYKKNISKAVAKEMNIVDSVYSVWNKNKLRSLSMDNKTNSVFFKNFHTTYIMVLITILCYIFIKNPNEYGVSYTGVIEYGNWDSTITYMFVHGGLGHLIGNMIALYYIGRCVERDMGSFTMLSVLMAGGFYGAIASMYGYMSDTVSVGMSGGIYALIGASLLINFKNKKYIASTIAYFMFNTFLQVVNPLSRIDYWCHIGGFLAGIVIVFAFILLRKLVINVTYNNALHVMSSNKKYGGI